MKYNAIIWDLDGTLLDTLGDLAASVNAALTKNGCPTRSIDEVRRFVGNGVENLMRRAMPEGREDVEFDRLFADFRAHYALHSNDTTSPYPGVIPALLQLKHQGIKMAVVSNKLDSAVKSLCLLHFGDLIDVAIGEREGVRRKPAPDSVLQAMELLGTTDAVYIGDSEVDIATAKNAELPCICVSWGFRSEETLRHAGAEKIAPDAEALMKLLNEEE
ncbi:MAG: HAD family hydrolase [Ruminococcaceae bacterium]|nr:HAD family hydrolase [Oscillospiraceae bacterium]